MQRVPSGFVALSASAVLLLACDSNRPLEPSRASDGVSPATAQTAFATQLTLPSLSAGPSEAVAVNAAGTVVVGHSWGRGDVLNAVTWTLRADGSWAISTLPYATSANSAIARGVSDRGDVAGNDFPGPTSKAMLWPAAGGFSILGCTTDVGAATVYGISAGGQLLVGSIPGKAAVWQPGACRVNLPPLVAGAASSAYTVNGDGTVVGGSAASAVSSSTLLPVRWTRVAGAWQAAQLDSRPGTARGANAVGDLAGQLLAPQSVGCAVAGGCQRAAIWYAAGSVRVLGTLGGADSWARDINSAGEVVGGSTAPTVGNTAYFWSPSRGMLQLPVKARWAAANAVSDVRPDGTRLVVGMDSQGKATAWVVR